MRKFARNFAHLTRCRPKRTPQFNGREKKVTGFIEAALQVYPKRNGVTRREKEFDGFRFDRFPEFLKSCVGLV